MEFGRAARAAARRPANSAVKARLFKASSAWRARENPAITVEELRLQPLSTAVPPANAAAGEAYIPVSLRGVDVNRPLPVDILNARGMLLLPKGRAMDSLERQLALSRHAPVIRAQDRDLWMTVLRPLHHPARRAAEAPPRPPPGRTAPDVEPATSTASAWLDLHARWRVLLNQHAEARDFLPRFEALRDQAWQLSAQQPDESLFALVQLLYDPQLSYSASNALAAAAVCRVIAPAAGLSEGEQQAVFNAALTMNVAMARLQDQLAVQKPPPDAHQRTDIWQHPHRGRDILQTLGVDNPHWLTLVADHHETVDGAGYPAGKKVGDTSLLLLQLADRFVARISPRRGRQGLSVRNAVRAHYLEMQRQNSPLGSLLVKHLGMYLPGSYVALKNGELAVVTRSTAHANQPMVMAIVGKDGIPLSTPLVRDTALPQYAVLDSVPPDQVKVRLNPARVFARG